MTTNSKATRWLCVITLLLQQFATTAVHAAGLDLDPPEVTHVAISEGVAGEAQSFKVRAFDLQGIQSVNLMIKSNLQDDYRPILMQSVPDTQDFIASTSTTVEQKYLDYYFLVIDTGGNKVLRGFPFEPFKRTLSVPASDTAITNTVETQPASTGSDAFSTSAGENNNQRDSINSATDQAIIANDSEKPNLLLWGAVSLLVLGVLASSGGGDSDSGVGEGGGATVPVTLTVPLPR